MKYFYLILITLVFTACSSKIPAYQSNVKTNSIEDIAKTSLSTFKNNDETMFIHYIVPDKNDMKAMLTYAMQKELAQIKDVEKKAIFSKKMEQEIEKASKQFKNEHTAIIKDIRIQWNDIQNTGLQHGKKKKKIIYAGQEFHPKDIYEVSGLSRGDITVMFSDMKKRYSYKLRDCVKMPYGNYRCVGIQELRK